MSVVSRTDIKKLVEKGEIVIYPYTPEKVGNCSVDIRLGNWFFRQSDTPKLIFPYKNGNVDDVWNPTPQQAEVNSRFPGRPVILLNPGEIILASSEEFIGAKCKCTTMAKTKSSLSRLGIDCFGSAGWGDIGFINRWSMLLQNKGTHTIALVPGTWIAQIVFLTVCSEESSYSESGGNYQSTDDFAKLVSTWNPKSLLATPLSYTSV